MSSNDNKLGSYITSLMTTIVDKESGNFVKQLGMEVTLRNLQRALLLKYQKAYFSRLS